MVNPARESAHEREKKKLKKINIFLFLMRIMLKINEINF